MEPGNKINKIEQIFSFFEGISSKLDSPVKVYVIGGAALMFRGLKSSTKDIDLVVRTKKDFELFRSALLKDGFKPKKPDVEYGNFHLSDILEKEDYRIDLFVECVCSKLFLSGTMAERAEKIYEDGCLKVMSCSNNDIFLFKSITERPGDKSDCITIARTGIDWDVFISEFKEQALFIEKDPPKDTPLWFAELAKSLNGFKKEGVQIPKKVFDEFYKLV